LIIALTKNLTATDGKIASGKTNTPGIFIILGKNVIYF
jgi:hypothetical protein